MKKYWIPLVLYIVMIGILLFPAIISGPDKLLYGDDIHHQYYFYRQFFNDWIRSGIFPWWNPYQFGGMPYVANPIINIWYPLNWLYTLLPLSYAYIIHFWFHLTLASFSMFCLVRFLLPRKEGVVPAFASGSVFVLSGFFSARIFAGHVDVIAASSYMPLVILLFFRVAEKSTARNVALAGLVFGLQLLSGYHTMGFFTLIAVGISAIFFALRGRTFRHVIPMIISIFLGFGISCVSLLPIQEFIRLSIRTISRPYSWASFGSLPVESFIKQLMSPFPYGTPITYAGPPPNYVEHAFFIGRITLFVMILGSAIGLFRKKLPSIIILFLSVCGFGVWMSLGKYAPLDLQHVLWRIIPFYQFLRIPPRHLILVVFGAAGLLGISLSRIPNRLVQILIASAIILELFFFARGFIQVKVVPEKRHDAGLISLFQKDQELFRIFPYFGCWIEPRSVLDFNEPMAYRIFSGNGYDPTLYRPYYNFIDAITRKEGSSVLEHDVQMPYFNVYSQGTSFLNIKYFFVPTFLDPFQGGSTQYQRVKEDDELWYRIYKNSAVFPRFFFVRLAKEFFSEKAVEEAIRSRAVDFSKEVALFEESESIPSKECSSTGAEASVKVLSYTPNRITLSVSTPCNSFLVSSEVMYPGWTAFVDGKPAPILIGNLAFRTLYVPKGEHTIEYRFVPTSAYIGGIISFITLGIVLLFVFSTKHTSLSHR